MSDENEPFLTTDEAAALLRISRQTVYNKVSQGELPHYKRDGILRFRRSELIAWLRDGNEEKPEPVAAERSA